MFSFRRLNRNEVFLVFREINFYKVIGYDMLFLRVFKMVVELLVILLIIIFNQVFEENCWFSVWKRGEWILIFKKEDFLDKVNYRLVIVLIVVDKIFEELICR